MVKNPAIKIDMGVCLVLAFFFGFCQRPIGFGADDPDGPVSLWHFDEGKGTSCHDSIGKIEGEFHGNVSWGDVAKGLAVSKFAVVFNSTPSEGQWIDFGTGDGKWGLKDKQSLTIMCCFKSSRWKQGDEATPFVQKYNWGNHFGWMLGSRGNGEIGMWLMNRGSDGKGMNLCATIPATEISLNQWHHACGVIDQKAREARFYLDGQLKTVAFIPEDYVMPDISGLPLLIGHCGLQPGGQPWDYAAFFGAIDDVAIYNRGLNDQEIAASVPDSIKAK